MSNIETHPKKKTQITNKMSNIDTPHQRKPTQLTNKMSNIDFP